MLRHAGAASRDQRAAVRQLPLLAGARYGVTRRNVGDAAGIGATGATATAERRAALADALRDAREYTLRLYAHLEPAQRDVPRLAIVNPPLWELGHVGWFQEFWCRRWRRDDPVATGAPSCLADADALFDSRHVAHEARWTLPLPDWAGVHAYLAATLADTLARLPALPGAVLDLVEMAVLHEDMHGEAMLMTLHTLSLPAPPGFAPPAEDACPEAGDVVVDGGDVRLGPRADDGARFLFDNEREPHTVALRPFAIARRPVTCGEFAAFVDDGGYREPRWWSEAGRDWLAAAGRAHPADWRAAQETAGWEVRAFERWTPLAAAAPLLHVNAHEAEAWCRWAGRRLPAEAEWEHAARCGAIPFRGVAWEWTATPFLPYPGFVPGAYAEYSAPWFGDHRSMRGGSWATRRRLPHPRFRNFYRPQRHDPIVGFRSCALAD